MTEHIDWLKVQLSQLELMLKGTKFEEFEYEEGINSGVVEYLSIIADSTNGNQTTDPAMVITEYDDIEFLCDFEVVPIDRRYAVVNLPGLYNFIYETVVEPSG